jgi:hypothetical protein
MNKELLFLALFFSSASALFSQPSSYELWREQLSQDLIAEGISYKLEQTRELLSMLSEAFTNNADTANRTPEIIFIYNFVRELWDQPTIENIDTIDRNWLEMIETDRLAQELGLETVSTNHITMVEDAQRVMNVAERLLLLKNRSKFDAHVGTSALGNTFMALCGTAELEYSLFIVYHELAHLVHNDTLLKNELAEDQSPRYFLELPEFKRDLDDIKNYTELGKHAFDDSTSVGRRVHKVLKEYDSFWIEPEDKETYDQMLVLRGTEQRADVLAFKKLFEQNHLNSLLRVIDLYAKQTGYWSVQAIKDEHIHPSAFERALYLAGFLVSRGIDVNKALAAWYEAGTCSSFLELNNQ